MAYGIVANNTYGTRMPEHVTGKQAKLIKYDSSTGEQTAYDLNPKARFPGLYLAVKSRLNGINYLITPRKLKGSWLLGLLGIKNEAAEPGTSIDSIVRRLEAKNKNKERARPKVPEPRPEYSQ